MYLLYSILLVFWGILLLPVFLYRAWRYHKYLPGFSQRLGQIPKTLNSCGRPTIWFHACSVGETLSLQPLVRFLHQQFPEARFVFSTITQPDRQLPRKVLQLTDRGTRFISRRICIDYRASARSGPPAMIVIIDTEIWPNLVNQAHRRGIPVVLANGRISAASFPILSLGKACLAQGLSQLHAAHDAVRGRRAAHNTNRRKSGKVNA